VAAPEFAEAIQAVQDSKDTRIHIRAEKERVRLDTAEERYEIYRKEIVESSVMSVSRTIKKYLRRRSVGICSNKEKNCFLQVPKRVRDGPRE